MWTRWLETALGAWLVAAPFVFGAAGRDDARLTHDLGAGLVVAALALASMSRRFRRAHLLILPVAVWLIAFGWLQHEAEPRALAQNHLLLGLTLLMTAILPTESTLPPAAWRATWSKGR
jgi:hypothetical protein